MGKRYRILTSNNMRNKKPKNKEDLSPESGNLKKRRINSRTKGNRYEQWVAKMFREKFGYQYAKTTRNSSRMGFRIVFRLKVDTGIDALRLMSYSRLLGMDSIETIRRKSRSILSQRYYSISLMGIIPIIIS